jgi:hypothetical protein
MSYRRNAKITPTEYRCINGPYANAGIWLETGSTGTIKVNEWHGHYSVTDDKGYYHERRNELPIIVWRDAA